MGRMCDIALEFYGVFMGIRFKKPIGNPISTYTCLCMAEKPKAIKLRRRRMRLLALQEWLNLSTGGKLLAALVMESFTHDSPCLVGFSGKRCKRLLPWIGSAHLCPWRSTRTPLASLA